MNNGEFAVRVDRVSKKYCKRLRYSVLYGLQDIAKKTLGITSGAGSLRANEFWALDDISFELKKGETLGIIGPNGAGKTTLLKLLNGILMPDKGRIEINGRTGALIEIGAGFHPLLTGRENIYINGAILGMKKKEIASKFDSIVNFADIGDFLDTPVKNYSSGMFVRLGFAVAIHGEPEILLIDEVLAVGDLGFMVKCFNKIGELKKNGTTIILVTHNMQQLPGFTKRGLCLGGGRIETDGEISGVITHYTSKFQNPGKYNPDIQKVHDGNEFFKVKNIRFIPGRILEPGDDLTVELEYESKKEYRNVEIAATFYRESTLSNSYVRERNDKELNILEGSRLIRIKFNCIPVNNDNLKLAILIWTEGHKELLFWWWQMGIFFNKADNSLGEIRLKCDFSIE